MTTRIKAILFVATFMLGAWLLSKCGPFALRYLIIGILLAMVLVAPFVSGRRT